MNKIVSILLATSLAIGLTGNASAGSDQRDWHDHRPSHSQRYDQDQHTPRGERHRGRDWIAPAAIIALGGLAIGTALHYSRTPPPAPAYIYEAPPAPAASQ